MPFLKSEMGFLNVAARYLVATYNNPLDFHLAAIQKGIETLISTNTTLLWDRQQSQW
nr:hypothetical protein [Nostoc sp. ChiSLP03a]